MTLNKVTLIGHLGHSPKVIEMKNGKKMMKLSIATGDYVQRQGSDQAEKITTWHDVTVFGCSEKLIDCLQRGTSVYVEGRPVTTTYLNKNNEEVKKTEIISTEFRTLGNRKKAEAAARSTVLDEEIDDD